MPEKIHQALELCDKPYQLAASAPATNEPSPKANTIDEDRSAMRLVRLCRNNFFMSRLFAGLPTPSFETASTAIRHFREIVPGNQKTLCFSRALYAAKTSSQFSKSGVVFIGVFLPSRSMHAWVIEDRQQPDPQDTYWTNFRPVAAIG